MTYIAILEADGEGRGVMCAEHVTDEEPNATPGG
jgi:hypothetical protein